MCLCVCMYVYSKCYPASVIVLHFMVSSKVWYTKQTIRNTVSAYPRMPLTWISALQNDNDSKLESRRS